MDLEASGNGGDHEDNDRGQELDSSGDSVGFKGGKSQQEREQYNGDGYQCGQ